MISMPKTHDPLSSNLCYRKPIYFPKHFMTGAVSEYTVIMNGASSKVSNAQLEKLYVTTFL